MLLQCSNCAGSVAADDRAVRRGVVTCDYCHTALRITKLGIETYKKRFLARKPPGGIRIKRSKSETRIIVPMGYEGIVLPGLFGDRRIWLDLVLAFVISIITWGMALSFYVPFWPSVIFIMLLVFLLFRLMLLPRPIRLQAGILKVPFGFSKEALETPVNEVEQFYVTRQRVQMNGKNSNDYHLFALKKDGKRVRLHGKFSSLEVALYVEEWLEIELDIFDLPVYGDVQTGTADVVDFQSQPHEQMICYACAAPLLVTTAEWQQGYLTCSYCRTITLLYTQDTHRLILGQPDPAKMVHRVLAREQFAGVLHKKDNQEILLLSRNKIKEAHFNKTLTGKAVKNFGIRKILVPRELDMRDFISGKLTAQYEQLLAYSEDTALSDASPYFEDHVNNTVQYMIQGQIGNRWYLFIPIVEDLHEAAFIVVTLNNFLESIGT